MNNITKKLFYLTVLNQNKNINNLNVENTLKIHLKSERNYQECSHLSTDFTTFSWDDFKLEINDEFMKYITTFLDEELIIIDDNEVVFLTEKGLKFLKKYKITSVKKLNEYILMNHKQNNDYHEEAMKLLYILRFKTKKRYFSLEYLKKNTNFTPKELNKYLTYLVLNNYLNLKIMVNHYEKFTLSFNGIYKHRQNLMRKFYYPKLLNGEKNFNEEKLYYVSTYLSC